MASVNPHLADRFSAWAERAKGRSKQVTKKPKKRSISVDGEDESSSSSDNEDAILTFMNDKKELIAEALI